MTRITRITHITRTTGMSRTPRLARSYRQRLWSLQHRYSAYLFVIPFALVFCSFFLYPLAQSVVLSLFRSAGPRETRFVGLDNYAFLLRDPLFWLSVANTVLFAFLFLLFQVPLSLGLALLLNSKRIWFRDLFRFAFFASYMVGNVFVAVIFMVLLAQRTGLVNHAIAILLPSVGSEINWRGDARFAMPAIVLAALWLSMGQAMIYFLAALQAVDPELHEAAQVDGAGRWAAFLHVTLPGIRPVLVYLLLVGTIYALQLFELPYVFFQGFGPRFAGMTVVGYLFMNGFLAGDIGYAAAAGWVLFVLISVVAFVQLKATGAAREL
jgi:ABC-type sugar transport system permease subunit